jgi:tetratricopeptide (TPR) repeat protein
MHGATPAPFLESVDVVRPRLLVLGTLLLAAATGCQGAALTYLRFSVSEGGRSVDQRRPFVDGPTREHPRSVAFELAQRGDVDGAIGALTRHLARRPGEAWSHYDLGLLYESIDLWKEAERELEEARRDNPHEGRFREELAFIAAHKGP